MIAIEWNGIVRIYLRNNYSDYYILILYRFSKHWKYIIQQIYLKEKDIGSCHWGREEACLRIVAIAGVVHNVVKNDRFVQP